jgi:hypothetical protein
MWQQYHAVKYLKYVFMCAESQCETNALEGREIRLKGQDPILITIEQGLVGQTGLVQLEDKAGRHVLDGGGCHASRRVHVQADKRHASGGVHIHLTKTVPIGQWRLGNDGVGRVLARNVEMLGVGVVQKGGWEVEIVSVGRAAVAGIGGLKEAKGTVGVGRTELVPLVGNVRVGLATLVYDADTRTQVVLRAARARGNVTRRSRWARLDGRVLAGTIVTRRGKAGIARGTIGTRLGHGRRLGSDNWGWHNG